MAQYQLKPQAPIEAAQYTAGLEDGFISFTSDTYDINPIPDDLDKYAHFWNTVVDSDDWTVSIPYIDNSIPLFPDDYVITPSNPELPKFKMSKADFESRYEPVGGVGLP